MITAALASLISLGLLAVTAPVVGPIVGPGVDPDIRGTTTCPTPGEVLVRLRSLLPGRGGLPPGAWLRLVDRSSQAGPGGSPEHPGGAADGRAADDVEVRLERAGDAAPVAVRTIARSGSCDDTADVVAVVLASWGSLFAPVPVAPAAASSPASAPEVGTTIAAQPAAPPGRPARRIMVGALAGFASTSGAGLAPVIGVDLDVRLGGSSSARIVAAYIGERETAFDTGSRVAWRRVVLLPALAWRWDWSGPFAELGAGPLAGLFLVEGRGFAPDASNTTVDLGGSAGARLGLRLPRAGVALWLDVGALAYARRQAVRADGQPRTQDIPAWDLVVAAALAWAPGN